mmetsp:Transcript_19943/g.59413  ORF Transcript_19943/g.59413 Transcript_19943/m.59413 type:complete len:275 (-) Transcript_19943:37-861(-)|eukprot:CAMPEP_0119269048 /NCGR_PEP_ID=MMETSP1329-20130426/6601_1 /TAXON_ID=114041 /ORGANISM="Genus nov. species nov., Strain RCC1024" /LENGTH=274 /DNA_ID=CAMNT_0007269035 /DNA_START=146 /DNA_END=970 /DNA_ORIENTATION=+
MRQTQLVTAVAAALCASGIYAFQATTAARPRAPTALSYKNVKTVSETIRAFETNYQQPIITLWTSPLNNLLQTTHISKMNQDWQYDPLFGYGFMVLMNLIMEAYPVPGEGAKITDALIEALDLEPATVRADHADIAAFVEGKSEADLLAAAAAGDGALGAAASAIKGQETYLHAQPGNIGLLAIMEGASVKPDKEGLDRWTAAFGMRTAAVERMSGMLKEYREKIAGAMQVVKAMEIREKKRMADALEEKAKAAQEKAEAAAGGAEAKKEAETA